MYRSSHGHIPTSLVPLFEVCEGITGHRRSYYRTCIHAFQDIQSAISGHAINKILKCNGPGPDLTQTKTGFGEVPDRTGKQKPGGLGMKAARLVKGMDESAYLLSRLACLNSARPRDAFNSLPGVKRMCIFFTFEAVASASVAEPSACRER